MLEATLTTFLVPWVAPRPGESYNRRKLIPGGLVLRPSPCLPSAAGCPDYGCLWPGLSEG